MQERTKLFIKKVKPLLDQGLTRQEIANRLKVSIRTVFNYKNLIYSNAHKKVPTRAYTRTDKYKQYITSIPNYRELTQTDILNILNKRYNKKIDRSRICKILKQIRLRQKNYRINKLHSKIKELYKQGEQPSSMVEVLKVSRSTIYNHLNIIYPNRKKTHTSQSGTPLHQLYIYITRISNYKEITQEEIARIINKRYETNFNQGRISYVLGKMGKYARNT